MNHASWQTKQAERKKTKGRQMQEAFDPTKTPAITEKLLEMDEQQLDMLTGQRGQIFKNEKESSVGRAHTMDDVNEADDNLQVK